MDAPPELPSEIGPGTAGSAARDSHVDAALGRAVAAMRPGWVVLRDCALAGDDAGAAAGRVRNALLHPQVGIALLDVVPGPTVQHAADRLRRTLDAAGFAAAHGWLPPIVHLCMPARSLADLETALDQEFAGRSSRPPPGDAAWVATVRRVLAARSPEREIAEGAAAVGRPSFEQPSPDSPRAGHWFGGQRGSEMRFGLRVLAAFWGLLALTFGGGVAVLHHLGPPGTPAVADGGDRTALAMDRRESAASDTSFAAGRPPTLRPAAPIPPATAPETRVADGAEPPRAAVDPNDAEAAQVPSPDGPLPSASGPASPAADDAFPRVDARAAAAAKPDAPLPTPSATEAPGPSPAEAAPALGEGASGAAVASAEAAPVAVDAPAMPAVTDAASEAGTLVGDAAPPVAVAPQDAGNATAASHASESEPPPPPDSNEAPSALTAAPPSALPGAPDTAGADALAVALPAVLSSIRAERTRSVVALARRLEELGRASTAEGGGTGPAGPLGAPACSAASALAWQELTFNLSSLPLTMSQVARRRDGEMVVGLGDISAARLLHQLAGTAIGGTRDTAVAAEIGAGDGGQGDPDAAVSWHQQRAVAPDDGATELPDRHGPLPSSNTAAAALADDVPESTSASATTPPVGPEPAQAPTIELPVPPPAIAAEREADRPDAPALRATAEAAASAARPVEPVPAVSSGVEHPTDVARPGSEAMAASAPAVTPPPRPGATPAPSGTADPQAGVRPSGGASGARRARWQRLHAEAAAAGSAPRTPAVDGRCRAIALKVQLGEEPSQADRSFLRAGCRR